MSEREPEATDPIDQPQPSGASPAPAPVDKTRRMLWAVGIGVGAYMIGRGVWGLATEEDETP